MFTTAKRCVPSCRRVRWNLRPKRQHTLSKTRIWIRKRGNNSLYKCLFITAWKKKHGNQMFVFSTRKRYWWGLLELGRIFYNLLKSTGRDECYFRIYVHRKPLHSKHPKLIERTSPMYRLNKITYHSHCSLENSFYKKKKCKCFIGVIPELDFQLFKSFLTHRTIVMHRADVIIRCRIISYYIFNTIGFSQ